ncbi:hypothetical protein AYI70_g3518 [Smittium culicis]|uniref:Uncharacterized protein n=1 Tax=Smittium culicis TaxID=133412 RepID=A0A1R1Y3G9_9FUNG|nr:hypothetical protein AYI70_g3518 [Smittium culicis]
MSDLMEKQNELITSPGNRLPGIITSRTGKEIHFRHFEVNYLEFRYIFDFEKKYIVVSELTKKATYWYKNAIDSEVGTWESLY